MSPHPDLHPLLTIHPLCHWVYGNVMNYRENTYYWSARGLLVGRETVMGGVRLFDWRKARREGRVRTLQWGFQCLLRLLRNLGQMWPGGPGYCSPFRLTPVAQPISVITVQHFVWAPPGSLGLNCCSSVSLVPSTTLAGFSSQTWRCSFFSVLSNVFVFICFPLH